MLDLNDLRVFEKVASLRGFSAAARELALPKSSVSRSIARLEEALGTRLLQRTTREVVLTQTGEVLHERCIELLDRVGATVDQIAGMTDEPRGVLKIGSGIGYGINVLSELLPAFLERFPAVEVVLDLRTEFSDLIAEGFDVAVRLGPLPDSGMIAVRINSFERILCATPAYLERHGTPASPQDLASHRVVEMPGVDGRTRSWVFERKGDTERVDVTARVSVNEVLTIHRLVANGVGLGVLTGYICRPMIEAGRLVRVLPEWSSAPVEVNLVFPSRRALSPSVRAFVEFMKDNPIVPVDGQ